jgi:hypothetical protein
MSPHGSTTMQPTSAGPGEPRHSNTALTTPSPARRSTARMMSASLLDSVRTPITLQEATQTCGMVCAVHENAQLPNVFSCPRGDRLALAIRPRPASWMHAGHPDQVGLKIFLAHVEGLALPLIKPTNVFRGEHGTVLVTDHSQPLAGTDIPGTALSRWWAGPPRVVWLDRWGEHRSGVV